jgi:hypothetical protein
MSALEPNQDDPRPAIPPLARRLSLRLRCARPEHLAGTDQQTNFGQASALEWIDALAESSAVRRTLVVVKSSVLMNQRSSLERGSAATRTVVRSISLVPGPDELTHISRINRR